MGWILKAWISWKEKDTIWVFDQNKWSTQKEFQIIQNVVVGYGRLLESQKSQKSVYEKAF